MGAALSLFGGLLGNFLTITIVVSQQETVPLLDVFLTLATSFGVVVELMKITFSPIDLLFYGIAIYFGYRYSFRRFSEAELASLLKEPV